MAVPLKEDALRESLTLRFEGSPAVERFRVSIFRCLNSNVLFALEQQPSKL